MKDQQPFVRPTSFKSFLAALRVQMRVIGALMMRELHTRYGRDNVGYLWMIIEPFTLASAVALLHARETSHWGSDIRPVPFAIIGYGTFIIFRGIFTRAEGTIESNQPLLYHRMVTLLDMMTARALLEGTGVGLTIVILLSLTCAVDMANPPARPLWLMLGEVMMVWWSWGAAMICCAGTHERRTVARLVHPGTYILMPLSGGFYVLGWIPQPYQDWLWYFPMVHIFEMARYGMFESASSEFINLDYVVGANLLLTVIGLLAIRAVRKHIHLQ